MNAVQGFFGNHRFLSNFHPLMHPIIDVYECIHFYYPTVEHAYQAMKTLDPMWRLTIMHAETPYQAKALARKMPIRYNWEAIKDDVMVDLVRHKFYHNADLKQRLIDTGDQELFEVNNWGDRYWGCDDFLDGNNHLGYILMMVREEVRDQF